MRRGELKKSMKKAIEKQINDGYNEKDVREEHDEII